MNRPAPFWSHPMWAYASSCRTVLFENTFRGHTFFPKIRRPTISYEKFDQVLEPRLCSVLFGSSHKSHCIGIFLWHSACSELREALGTGDNAKEGEITQKRKLSEFDGTSAPTPKSSSLAGFANRRPTRSLGNYRRPCGVLILADLVHSLNLL